MKIVLIRHAEVDIIRDVPIYALEMGEWIDTYNNTRIKSNIPSKNEIDEILKNSDRLCCSGLRRSSDSLALLGKTADEQDTLFDEVGTPYADWRGVKLYPDIWLVLFRVAWFVGYTNRSESFKESKSRAKKATNKLIELCENNATVTLLGHGIMNKLIARELLKIGWKKRGKFGIKNWSYGIFEMKNINNDAINNYKNIRTASISGKHHGSLYKEWIDRAKSEIV